MKAIPTLVFAFTVALLFSACKKDRVCTCSVRTTINNEYVYEPVGDILIPDATYQGATNDCQQFEKTWQATVPGTECGLDRTHL